MRAVRSRLVAALGALATAALVLSGPLATTSALAAPLAAAPSADTAAPQIGSVILEPHFIGEPSWPSTTFPTAALRIAWSDAAPVPGASFDIDLSSELTAAAVPGTVHDQDGRVIAHYAVSQSGQRITVTYDGESGDVVNLSAELAIFVSTEGAGPSSNLLSGAATIGETAYPVSTALTGLPWNSLGTVGTWTVSASGTLRFIARTVIESDVAAAAEGGQWIGVGGAAGLWPGTLEPVSGATRVFALDALPSTLAGFTDSAPALVSGVDYTVDEADIHNGQTVFGIRIPTPSNGYIAVEQQFDLVSDGGVILTGTNSGLPDAGRRVYAAGTSAAWGTVDAHEQGGSGSGVSGGSSLTFFAGSGGSATSENIDAKLALTRDTTSVAGAAGSASGTTTLTLQNTGNTALDVTLTDQISATGANVALRDARASIGTAAITADTAEWTLRLAAGTSATLSYTADARATGTDNGSVTFSGSAVGVAPSNSAQSTSVTVTDGSLAVSGLPVPVDPVDPVDPDTPSQPATPQPAPDDTSASRPSQEEALARTGAAAEVAPLVPIAAAALLAGGVFALAARRRRR